MFDSFLALIENGDVCSLTFLTLLFVGQWFASRDALSQNRGAVWGAAVFLAYLIYGVSHDGIGDPGLLIVRVLRAGLAAGMSTGVAWIILPSVSAVERYGKATSEQRRARCQQQRRAQEEARQDQERKTAERRRSQELARTAPEREQQRIAAELAAQEAAVRRANEQQRREAARLECQLLYERHSIALRELFPRNRFEAHLAQWLGDNRPADLVEQHAEKLRQLIQELVSQTAAPKTKSRNLREIAEHFAARRNEVASLPFDEETKDTLRAMINTQENSAMQDFFKT